MKEVLKGQNSSSDTEVEIAVHTWIKIESEIFYTD